MSFELRGIGKSCYNYRVGLWVKTDATCAIHSPFSPHPPPARKEKKGEKILFTCQSKGTNRYIDQRRVGYDLNTSKWESFPTPSAGKNDPYRASIGELKSPSFRPATRNGASVLCHLNQSAIFFFSTSLVAFEEFSEPNAPDLRLISCCFVFFACFFSFLFLGFLFSVDVYVRVYEFFF